MEFSFSCGPFEDIQDINASGLKVGCVGGEGCRRERTEKERKDEAGWFIKVQTSRVSKLTTTATVLPVPHDNSTSNPHCSSSVLACVTLEKSNSSPMAFLKISQTSMQVVSKWVVASYDLEINSWKWKKKLKVWILEIIIQQTFKVTILNEKKKWKWSSRDLSRISHWCLWNYTTKKSNGISTFIGYLIPKPSLSKNSSDTI